jgi:hypothetical protein
VIPEMEVSSSKQRHSNKNDEGVLALTAKNHLGIREYLDSQLLQCTGTTFHTILIFSSCLSLKQNSVKLLIT